MGSMKHYPATNRKRRRARQEGDVAKSRELTGVAAVTGGLSVLLFAQFGYERFLAFIAGSFEVISDQNTDTIKTSFSVALSVLGDVVAPFLAVVCCLVVACEYLQVGPGISFTILRPQLSRLSLWRGLKRIIGLNQEEGGSAWQFFYELLKPSAILIVGMVAIAVVLRNSLPLVAELSELEPVITIAVTHRLVVQICFAIVIFVALVAVVDLLLMHQLREKRLRMDREEFKSELRESEGDPFVRGFRKQLHQEILVRNLVEGVRSSKVVVIGVRGNDRQTPRSIV